VHLLSPGPPLDLPGLYDLYDPPARSVRGGMVLSADGAAAHDGSSLPLSTPADKVVFRTLRAVADVVLVGAGTARAEDYGPIPVPEAARAWRGERGRPPRPPLAVVSRALDLDPGQRCFTGQVRPLIVTCAAAPPARRAALAEVADVVIAGEERVDLAAALAALADRGLGRVLCEGGPSLLAGLVGAGLLDELCMTLSPLLAGTGPGMLAAALPAPVPLELVHVLEEQGSLLLRYAVGGSPGQ
jgi:riboflavin biosynthesis pyrimidine reductase